MKKLRAPLTRTRVSSSPNAPARAFSRFTAIALLAASAIGLAPREARAFELGFVGGLSSSYQSFAERSFGTGSSAKATFAFGTLLNFYLLPMLSLETGVIHSTHKTGTTLGFAQTTNLVIPVTGRLWLLPILSVGAGPYYSMGLGRIRAVSTPAASEAVEVNVEYSDAGYSKSDFGLVLSGNLSFPFAQGLNALADLRHHIGIKDRNVSGSGPSERVRFTQLLVGIQFTY